MKYYPSPKVTHISALGEHRLHVTFEDGFAAEIDLVPLLDCGPIFEPLRDEKYFAQVTTVRGAPLWPGDIDLSPASLRAWCEAGRFMDYDETDEWIERHSERAHSVA